MNIRLSHILVVVLLIVLYIQNCQTNVDDEYVETEETITIKENKDSTESYKPKPDSIYKKDNFIFIPIEVKAPNNIDTFKVDTSKIVADYLSKVYYKDSIKLDSIGYVIIKDTVQGNRIQWRKVTYNYSIKEKTITNTVYKNKNKFYLGGSLNTRGGTGVGVLYKSKKDNVYRLSPKYNLTGNGRLYIEAGVYIRL